MAKKKAIGHPLKFQIKAVELLNSHLQPTAESLPINQVYSFNIALEQKLEPTSNSLIVITNVDISAIEKLDLKLASASVACVFVVENFSEVVKFDKNKKVTIAQNIIDMLNSISISTTRGVLSQIIKGTFLHHAVLPIIDPMALKKVK